MQHEFFKLYFHDYIGIRDNTEAPANIHRWCAISLLGAMLGRQFYYPFGHAPLMPNQYIQIIGVPATRKSTAIKQAKKLLQAYGFEHFAPEKVSLEKFLMEMHEATWGSNEEEQATSILEENLFGTANPKEQAANMTIAESYIASDEFVDFIGRNNLDFISLLGTLWDYVGVYDRKLKHSKPVYINEPIISILAGNTPTGFNQAFPPDVQGQGFFSRLLLIAANPSGKKVYPIRPPSESAVNNLTSYMTEIQKCCIGTAKILPETDNLLSHIYHTWEPIRDPRFEHYSGRRFSHLIKLSLIMAASRISATVTPDDVLLANTILTYAEHDMPKAMGEFGKSRYSAVAQKIVEFVNSSTVPVTITAVSKVIYNDLDNLSSLTGIMQGLYNADKLQTIDGFICPKHAIKHRLDSEVCKPSWLEQEEREV